MGATTELKSILICGPKETQIQPGKEQGTIQAKQKAVGKYGN